MPESSGRIYQEDNDSSSRAAAKFWHRWQAVQDGICMKDGFGREIEYMRISITDRCNLRCRYCMPDGIRQVPASQILSYEQIEEIVSAAAGLGITRIKVTGGEPLARLGCPEMIAGLKQIPGIRQVTMTTNGVLLGQYLAELREAGLDGVNISLDTLNRETFRQITGRDQLPAVLEGLEVALREAELSHRDEKSGDESFRVKVNCVLQKGVNDREWTELAGLARSRELDVRFIEMMPVGHGSLVPGVSNTELFREMHRKWPDIHADASVHGNGPAVYMRIPGWRGSIGFISAMHGKFCGRCNRIRLTSQGKLKPCLCYGETEDLMRVFREHPGGEEEKRRKILTEVLEKAVREKPAAHCFENRAGITEQMDMVSIGG